MRELAVQGSPQRTGRWSRTTIVFGLAALVAAVLSLAAALAATHTSHHKTTAALPAVVDQLAARNARIDFFEQRVAADPIDAGDLNILAGEYLQRARETGDVGDYGRAEYAAAQSVKILPTDNYSGWVELASVRLVQHNYAEALDLSREAIVNRPDISVAYGTEADALVGLGRYDEAATVLQKMVELDPTLPTLSRLANLAYMQGDLLNAIDFWKQSLTTAEGLPTENVAWVHAQLALMYYAQGDLTQAESQEKQSLAIYPNYVIAQAGLAQVLAAQGHWSESEALYETTQQRLPQLPNIVALVDVYHRAGDADKEQTQRGLVDLVDKLYQANGINTDLSLALFYADHDLNLDEALTLAQASYDSAPNVYAADALAWAEYKQGNLADAQRYSDEALSHHTPEALFLYHAGMIRYAAGDRAAAESYLDQALKLNPRFSVLHSDEARKLLDDLKAGR